MPKYYYGGIDQNNSYKKVLSILSARDSLNSVRTSTLPLAQFWGEKGLKTRLSAFKQYLDVEELLKADKYFEFPTVVKGGIGKASMTDLMLLTDKFGIAIEAKYTEYNGTRKYETVSEWSKKRKKTENAEAVLDGWLSYMGKKRDEISNLDSIPYQLIHRIASAYAVCVENKRTPVVVYQLFSDANTKPEDIEGFVDCLGKGMRNLALADLTFVVVRTEIDNVPPDIHDRNSEYFLNMCEKERNVYGELNKTTVLLHKASRTTEIKRV